MIELAVVFVLFAGAVIATTGTLPRVTLTLAGVPAPNWLVQLTVSVLEPTLSGVLLLVALEEATPATVHPVPAGIEAAPPTV